MENRPVLFGSHNTMSYLKPNFRGLQWLLWPFIMIVYYITARCQSDALYNQFKKGARVFDLRICSRRYLKPELNNWIFAHGILRFDERVHAYDVIKELHEMAKEDNTKVYIRIILEQCVDIVDERNFESFCQEICNRFNDDHAVFFGGNRRADWEKLYTFPKNSLDFNDINNNQWVSSMASDAKWYEKICPYLYAKRMNSTNFNKMSYLTNLFDFIPTKHWI